MAVLRFDKWILLNSSFISSCMYSNKTNILQIKMKRGELYTYTVSDNIFEGLLNAFHPGKYYNEYIKDNSTHPKIINNIKFKKPDIFETKDILPKDIITAIDSFKTRTDNSTLGQIFSPTKIALMFAPPTVSAPISAILTVIGIIKSINKMRDKMKKSTAVIELNS